MMKYLIILLVLLQALNIVENHRILGLFIHQINSHFDVFYPIMNGLAERGHNVTLLTHFEQKNRHPNYHEVLMERKLLPEFRYKLAEHVNDPSESIWGLYMSLKQLKEWGETTCQDALNSQTIDRIMNIHKREPFDIIITELFISDCMLGVVHLLDLPYVDISSCGLLNWHNNRVGQPNLPSHLPTPSMGFSEKMSLTQRTMNWLNYNLGNFLFRIQQENERVMLSDKLRKEIPDLGEVAKNVSLILINSYFASSTSRPHSQQVVEIGGIHLKKEKPLPKELKETLDKATNGAIVISWGSIIRGSTLSEFKRNAIIKALSRMTYQIVWKWENITMAGRPGNVFIQNWLPQQDTLCHPNVKLFWSHGGNLGTTEAVHCGVPLVVTPIYGDQFHNGAVLQARNVAKVLKYDAITEETVFETLNEVLGDSYQEAMKKVSFAFRNRPMTPLKTALWWIEHVLATGGNTFVKTHAIELSWFVYHSLDVLMVLVIVISLLFGLCAVASAKCCRSFRKTSRKIKKK